MQYGRVEWTNDAQGWNIGDEIPCPGCVAEGVPTRDANAPHYTHLISVEKTIAGRDSRPAALLTFWCEQAWHRFAIQILNYKGHTFVEVVSVVKTEGEPWAPEQA